MTLAFRRFTLLLLLLASWQNLAGYEHGDSVPADFKMPDPLTLEQSVKSLQTLEDWSVELMASEPLTMDPIFLDWGTDGRLWIVEMADYPLGMDGKNKPGGRIRYLLDTDQDGKYDQTTLFLDGLNFPTGVKVWKKGVIVIAAPEIFYAEDTDGDGKADKREVLFRGFREGNQQHRVNGLWSGLDNWLYIANGDSGGKIESVKTGETMDLGSFDLKVRPDTGELQRITGRSQFGRARDAIGNWFGCNNSRPLFQFVLDDKYLKRNPHVIYPSPVHLVPEIPHAPPVHPISKPALRYNDPHAASRITSGCGIAIHQEHAYICEPVHNLVHRQKLTQKGAAFTSVPADGENEFFASSDPWVRPASCRVGPDGAIWIADMYRYVIEHPEWIPAEWQKVLDLRAGADKGRVYRIWKNKPAPIAMGNLSGSDLVKQLKSPIPWRREMAQQLIVDSSDEKLISPLQAMAIQGDLVASSHAVGALEGLGKLDAKFLARVLSNKASPNAIRLTEPFSDKSPDILQALLDLEVFPHNVGMMLGGWTDPKVAERMSKLLLDHSEFPFIVAGLMSSLRPHLGKVVELVCKNPDDPRLDRLMPYLMSTAVGEKNHNATAALLTTNRFSAFAQFFAQIDRQRVGYDQFLETSSPKLRTLLENAEDVIGNARQLAKDGDASPEDRSSAVTLLGRRGKDRENDIKLLTSLLGPQVPPNIQVAAVRRLRGLKQEELLLKRWDTYLPDLRRSILSACLEDRDLAGKLLDSVESKKIDPVTIDPANRDRLLRYPNGAIRTRAKKVLGEAANPDRQQVVEKFASAIQLKGDSVRGKEQFTLLCSACHQADGVGRKLGADLSALSDRSPQALIIAILDPNRAVEDKFLLHEIRMKDGRVLPGMITREVGDQIEVQLLDGSIENIARNQLESLRNSGRSAMPEGLEAVLDPQKMADLISFLRAAVPSE